MQIVIYEIVSHTSTQQNLKYAHPINFYPICEQTSGSCFREKICNIFFTQNVHSIGTLMLVLRIQEHIYTIIIPIIIIVLLSRKNE